MCAGTNTMFLLSPQAVLLQDFAKGLCDQGLALSTFKDNWRSSTEVEVHNMLARHCIGQHLRHAVAIFGVKDFLYSGVARGLLQGRPCNFSWGGELARS